MVVLSASETKVYVDGDVIRGGFIAMMAVAVFVGTPRGTIMMVLAMDVFRRLMMAVMVMVMVAMGVVVMVFATGAVFALLMGLRVVFVVAGDIVFDGGFEKSNTLLMGRHDGRVTEVRDMGGRAEGRSGVDVYMVVPRGERSE